MPTVRTAAAALAAVLLIACNSKKQTTALNQSGNAAAAVTTLPDDTLQMQQLSGEFINYTIQKFIVAKAKTAVVTGKKGLRVTVNPSALEKNDGTAVDGAVEVRMAELTTGTDLFKANAATVSNGRLLTSGGSYLIEMWCNGQQLQVKKGKTVAVDFPVLSNDEMELFYGSRNEQGNMNWINAGQQLQVNNTVTEAADAIMFTDSNRYTADVMPVSFMYDTNGNVKIYRSVNEQVYYYETKVTIQQLVDTINKHSHKIFLDTVYMWPKAPANIPAGARVDSNFLYKVYGPPKQFIIKRCKEAEELAAKKEKARLALQQARENWQPKTLAGQIQKYYSTVNIASFGWLNCDRFYKGPQNSDVEIELPITLNKYPLHYFLIFKEFTGLVSGSIRPDSLQQYNLINLPNNQQVTLVAFIKAEGKIYQCKKDFTVDKNVLVKTSFEEISAAALHKIFGSNVKI